MTDKILIWFGIFLMVLGLGDLCIMIKNILNEVVIWITKKIVKKN